MTEPLSHPPTCYLFIDGVRYNDGCTPDELPTEPVALTDLRVVWGRPTSVDQPSPATAEFSILDLPGGVRFLDTCTWARWSRSRPRRLSTRTRRSAPSTIPDSRTTSWARCLPRSVPTAQPTSWATRFTRAPRRLRFSRTT